MTKRNILIIGAGGVAHVAAHKCAMYNDILGNISIASRTQAKCDAIAQSIYSKNSLKIPANIATFSVEATDIEAVKAIIIQTQSQIVLNLGSAFVNMSVLQACIDTGAAYLDTAIHEDPAKICEAPPWYANYEWKKKPECAQKGITAILGVGFDPGVVNAYARLAYDDYFDSISDIDIIDINAGSHGRYFATNFDPEINFREFTGQVWSWQNQQWQTNRMFEVARQDDLPVVGQRTSYLTGHDEIHSLSVNLNVPNIRFWMGFGEQYITVFNVLNNLGLLSEQPVITAEGQAVIPLKVVKAVLPNPSSLAPDYSGKTCIGVKVQGQKNAQETSVFIYNIADHELAYQEVGSQAISYTAGIPAVAAAILIAQNVWDVQKMVNVEELPPKPLLELIGKMGLATRIQDEVGDRALY